MPRAAAIVSMVTFVIPLPSLCFLRTCGAARARHRLPVHRLRLSPLPRLRELLAAALLAELEVAPDLLSLLLSLHVGVLEHPRRHVAAAEAERQRSGKGERPDQGR